MPAPSDGTTADLDRRVASAVCVFFRSPALVEEIVQDLQPRLRAAVQAADEIDSYSYNPRSEFRAIAEANGLLPEEVSMAVSLYRLGQANVSTA